MALRVFGGWETMGKKSKLVARTSLCDNQCHSSTMMNTMKGNLSDTIWDIVWVNHWHATPGVDESCHILGKIKILKTKLRKKKIVVDISPMILALASASLA